MWIKNFCIEYIFQRILTTKSVFDVGNVLKKVTVKGLPMNNKQLLNIHACSFNVFWNPISSDKLQVLSSSPNIH